MAIFSAKIKGILGIFIISLGIFFSLSNCLASVTENFDSYENLSFIYLQPAWSTSQSDFGKPYVSTFASSSPPKSLYVTGNATGGQTAYARYINTTNDITDISYDIYFTSLQSATTSDTSQYGFNYPDNVRSWTLYFTSQAVYLVNGTHTATTTVYSGTVALNTWHDIRVLTYPSGYAQAFFNASSSALIPVDITVLSKYTWASSPDYSNYFIDNLVLDGAGQVEIVDLPEENGTVSIISDEDNPLIFDKKNICYIDYGYCYLFFKAWPVDIGNTVYIYNENDPLDWIGSTLITNNANYDGLIPLRVDLTELQSTSTTINYGAYLDRNNDGFTYDDRFINHIPITWRTIAEEETNLVNLGISQQCDKFNLFPSSCSNLATTSDWLNIGYSLQCAGQTLLYQFIGVSTSTCLRFYDSLDKFTNSFPFNIISYVASTTKNSGLSATTSATVVIAPLRWYNKSTHQYEDTGVSLLSNKTFETGMGATLYAFYYLWFERLLWILCFGYIFWRVLRVMNPSLSAGFSFGPLPDARDRYYKHRVEEYKQQKRFYDIQETARNMMRKK